MGLSPDEAVTPGTAVPVNRAGLEEDATGVALSVCRNVCSNTNTQPRGEGSRQVPRAISAEESRETLWEPSPGHSQRKSRRRENITALSQGAACKEVRRCASTQQAGVILSSGACVPFGAITGFTAPQVPARVPQSLSQLSLLIKA